MPTARRKNCRKKIYIVPLQHFQGLGQRHLSVAHSSSCEIFWSRELLLRVNFSKKLPTEDAVYTTVNAFLLYSLYLMSEVSSTSKNIYLWLYKGICWLRNVTENLIPGQHCFASKKCYCKCGLKG